MWAMLERAGVRRCYGIVGDALNPVIDALRRNGKIEFIHVRHEEYGVFAAVAEAYLTDRPVAVCGTAGPGVTHLFNGLMDARKEGASIIAIAGDVETRLMDTSALEELNPYKFFESACLYVGRVVNAEQAQAVINTAILTAVIDHGPTVISMPGDVAAADAPFRVHESTIPVTPVFRPADGDLEKLVQMIEDAKKVAIFGGDGCRDARAEVLALAAKLKGPGRIFVSRQAVAGARQSTCCRNDGAAGVRRGVQGDSRCGSAAVAGDGFSVPGISARRWSQESADRSKCEAYRASHSGGFCAGGRCEGNAGVGAAEGG
jgi:thiamine pyrophosphate-dependent acetolactate synthase large subunit-like protein